MVVDEDENSNGAFDTSDCNSHEQETSLRRQCSTLAKVSHAVAVRAE